MKRMPWRAHPATISGSDHCLRTVAVLIDSSSGSGGQLQSRCGCLAVTSRRVRGSVELASSVMFMRAQARSGVDEHAGNVRQPEQFDQVHQVAGALLAADHDEVLLVSVEPGDEYDTGLVEARWRAEDMAGQRDGRREDRVEFGAIARPQRGKRRRRDGCDRIEDAEQGVRITQLVAGDQFREVEIVAGVHAHAQRQATAHDDFPVLVEQRDLDAIDLGDVHLDHGQANVHRRLDSAVTPVAGERRIEHVAQPMQNDRLAHLRQNAPVDLDVVVG